MDIEDNIVFDKHKNTYRVAGRQSVIHTDPMWHNRTLIQTHTAELNDYIQGNNVYK